MLILARKVGQCIEVGDNIEIMVVEVRGDQVRLGITAPRSIAVHRKEILEQVAAENIQAASTAKAAADLLGALNIGPSPEQESCLSD